MKKFLFYACTVFGLTGGAYAQVYLPIPTTGYNLDAIAENTTALSTTGGVIDGSNNALYSNAYGIIYGGGVTTGLPNSGLIANGTRTYQLQSYTTTNVLYLLNGQADTLLVTTPAPYPTLSMLCFATEGIATMSLKVRFSDGTSQLFSNITVDDWFSTTSTNTVLVGFDRVSRPTGVPNYNSVNPKMFRIDLNLSCANRLKNVSKIIVQNGLNNARLCMMALSGGLSASYSVTTSPVTCSGGSNGSASLTVTNGVPPFTYTFGTSPAQASNTVNLPAGITNYTVTDASSCTYTSFVNIAQALIPQPALTVTASQNPICINGSLTLSTSGANSYTWSSGGNTNSTTLTNVPSTGTYSVVGTTSVGCTLSGNITVTVIPLPVISFTSVPNKLCLNSAAVPLNATPAGGSFAGAGISFGSFYPTLAGIGTQTISYTYSDPNNCTSVNTVTTTISSPTTVIAFAITPATLCTTSSSITLNATPAGGVFTGTGVTGSILTPSLAGAGTKTVSYTFTDANNCTASKLASVIISVCSTVGFNALSKDAGYEVYPNPNNGSFYVKADRDIEFTIVSETGQALQSVKLTGNNEHSVWIENLPAGIYFLLSADRSLNQKIIVTR